MHVIKTVNNLVKFYNSLFPKKICTRFSPDCSKYPEIAQNQGIIRELGEGRAKNIQPPYK